MNPFSSVGHGDIRGFADGSRYLLEPAIKISSIVLQIAMDEQTNAAFLKRLELGIPAGALPLTELGVQLNRGEILRLWQSGIGTRENVLALSQGGLQELIGVKGRRLFAAVSEEIIEEARALETGT